MHDSLKTYRHACNPHFTLKAHDAITTDLIAKHGGYGERHVALLQTICVKMPNMYKAYMAPMRACLTKLCSWDPPTTMHAIHAVSWTEGDSFITAWHGPAPALRFALQLQAALLAVEWPPELLIQVERGRSQRAG